jgi:lactate dehydrogenase-like 2-hydroxyacid dehydrogenase
MKKSVFITRRIPDVAKEMLESSGFEVFVSPKDGVLTKEELKDFLKQKPYDAVLSLLTDHIDKEVFQSVPTAKIFANYAVGFNNINLEDAKSFGVTITNTPTTSEEVAEHTVALILSLTKRICEGDKFIRAGKYDGWDPLLLLGTEIEGKTFGILGAGRIGRKTAKILKNGFGMNIVYFDVFRNEEFEKEMSAVFYENPDDVFKISDIVSVHTPLTENTRHLVNKERLSLMKKTAYLVNTSRGPVVNENDLASVLESGLIAGAGLDVFEFEPKITEKLLSLDNVVLTPHTASSTISARNAMAKMAASNIIDFLEGKEPKNKIV